MGYHSLVLACLFCFFICRNFWNSNELSFSHLNSAFKYYVLILKSKLGFNLLGLHVSTETPVDKSSPELKPGIRYPTSLWLDSVFFLIRN